MKKGTSAHHILATLVLCVWLIGSDNQTWVGGGGDLLVRATPALKAAGLSRVVCPC